jgi:hypothetical protein
MPSKKNPLDPFNSTYTVYNPYDNQYYGSPMDQYFFSNNEITTNPEKQAISNNMQNTSNGNLFGNIMQGIGYGANALLSLQQEQRQDKFFKDMMMRRLQQNPIYDYNYMYGNDQPIIKAEEGAEVRTAGVPSMPIEIEGGEFLILPDGTSEIARGPKHSKGGIPTVLPDKSIVYSNKLKPYGSDKTFAQIAKKHDYTKDLKTLQNPFSTDVARNSAQRMFDRKKKTLADLFKVQQVMNGNSTGEPRTPEMEAQEPREVKNPNEPQTTYLENQPHGEMMAYGGYMMNNGGMMDYPPIYTSNFNDPRFDNYPGPVGYAFGGPVYEPESLHYKTGGQYDQAWSVMQKGGMMKEQGGEVDSNVMEFAEFKDGGIHIKPENVGKFTAWAKRHNMSVQEAASHIMANKEKYSSTLVKRANFAKNATKFKHEEGGEIENDNDDKEMVEGVADILSKVKDVKNRKDLAKYMTNQFKDENVSYDPEEFLEDVNLTEMDYPGQEFFEDLSYAKGGIHINPANKGKFTAWAQSKGMSVPEAAAHVMANKEKYSATIVKRANFAKNAAKWKHQDGGEVDFEDQEYAGTSLDNPGFKALPQEVQENIIENMEMGGQMMYANGGINNPGFKALPVEVQQKIISNMENGGQLIKRADGSYSQRGLWDNIRANKGSGKKPTKEMLEQEKKIKAQYEEGGMIDDNDDEEIIFSKGGVIPERYKNMGFSRVGQKKDSSRPGKKWMVLAKKGNQYKVVHGGYKGMQDFTQHHSEKRRDNFWNRMGGKSSSKATDPFSPLYWHKRFGTWEEGGVIDYDNYEVGREYDLDEKEIQRLQKLGYKISFK